jgi:two-component system, NtrC family, response regulator GlrR
MNLNKDPSGVTKVMESEVVLLLQFERSGHVGETLRQTLESSPDRGFEVACHTSQEVDGTNNELSKLILRQKPLLILLALPCAQMKSLDVLLRILGPVTAPIVVAVENVQEEELSALERPGIADFLILPLRESEVLIRLRRLMHQVRQERAQQTMIEKLGLQQLIGESPAFIAEISKIPVVAKSDITVMISGETGTGKEMVGRAIHYLSSRAGKPFVPINCGAIPVELMENELFGHDRGAFTGASGSRNGLIQEAEQGTLFFDEVNCLPLQAQVKLLRFLQSREYRPLGSTKSLTGDVRIIAASNANLEAEVKVGTLRRDLYYRLNVVPIVLPPLRERSSDTIILARHFLAQYAKKLNSPAIDFSPDAERKLLLYSWPGNVRELEHVIERVVVLCTERIIQDHHIVLPGVHEQPHRLSFQEMKARVVSQFEADYIQNLLTAYRGNITQAAQAAQKERRTFWELMRKHKIDVQKFKLPNGSEQGNRQFQLG